MQLIKIIPLLFMQANVNPANDVIPDKIKYEIAAAQRDYLINKQRLDSAMLVLRSKIDIAEKFCVEINKEFSIENFNCADKVKK